MIGYNTDLFTQTEQLSKILSLNKSLYEIIEKAENAKLKNYYVGAGCITQTVWNFQMGFELSYGISDVDFVYYDNSDLSFEAENNIIERATKILEPTSYKLDIKNQARVHLWYKERFGYDIEPYKSVEGAINTRPTTATSIGVRLENGAIKIYAPFGLNDLFGMIVRANKAQIT